MTVIKNAKFSCFDEKADKVGVAHKRALAIIQRDLNRRDQLDRTVRQEIHTDRGDTVDENTGENVSQPVEE